MILLPEEMSEEENYKLVTSLIVPRPIAWVTTLNADGGVNLAPFSAFTFVSTRPPMIGISIGRKGSKLKDTARNIQAMESYVVHIADRSMIAAVHASSEEMPADVSEAAVLKLDVEQSAVVDVPRLKVIPVAMECVLRQVLEFGEARSRFIVGEVVCVHVRDELIVDGRIQTKDLDPICRLGGPNYATLGAIGTIVGGSYHSD